MTKKTLIVLNPTTNHGRSVKIASDLRPLASQHKAEWRSTEYPGHAIEIARSAGDLGYDMVIAAGGDGTVHEVINGLMQIAPEKRPVLGIIPLGSGNDFAHILDLPNEAAKAFIACFNGQPHALDMASVKSDDDRLEYFNNTIGIGFDAAVNTRTRKIKLIHGFLMYLVATLQTIFFNFKPMDLQVETDEGCWNEPVIMLTIGNGPREGGGFNVTPDAKTDDGILNYAAIRKISRLMMLRLLPEVMNGTHPRFKQVRMGTCRSMSITSKQPLYTHCDGEIFTSFGMDVRKLMINVIPDAIQFMK
ncbi:MAG: diacylglycerol kinase family lipid kinase [Anaerolineaceae bacterium]|nr:diacylglycerol kinase family lipid kinase [Anaerolineaceae bacterium]